MAENIQSIKQHRTDWVRQGAHWLKAAAHTIRIWHKRQQSRRLLAQLPSYLLKDIGVTQADRFEEANKPFWKE